MASIAVGTALGLVVFASAEALATFFFIALTFEHKLQRLVGTSLNIVGAVTEWLILGATACTVIVSFTLLECLLVRPLLGHLRSLATDKLGTVSNIR